MPFDANRVLKIVHLEDDVGSFELVRALLEAEQVAVEFVHADDAATYRRALTCDPPDLILSDYNLPTIDGATALELRRDYCPNVPFIFLSGALGEETAISLLHQGATDVILKDNIVRLPAAIKRALAEAREHIVRLEAEHALRESEARFRRLAENAPDVIFRYAFSPPPSHYEYISPAVEAILGYPASRFVEDPHFGETIVHPEDRHLIARISREQVIPQGAIELRWIHRDGQELIIEQRYVAVRDDTGHLIAVEGIARDITARKQASERLRILSEAIDQSPVAVEITDHDNRLIFVNPRLTEISGYSAGELIGKTPDIFRSGHTPQETFDDLWSKLDKGETWRGEFINRRKDGDIYHVRATITPILDTRGATQFYLAVKEDITAAKAEAERRRLLEAQLLQAQKLETIGTLAGGIAHDFNNILTGILGFAQMAQLSLEKNHPAHEDLQEVYAGALRARDLVAQILTFSRRTESKRTPLDLSRLVSEAVKFMRASAPATIEIVRHLEPGLVLADPTQMHQVVLNLATNAIQAMSSGPGRLAIDVRHFDVIEPRSCRIGQLQTGPHVMLAIADTGPGMKEQTLARIFDPFFTTKPQGEGTGLGLSLVQGIVASHEGAIDVHSTPGEGTRFEVILPMWQGESDEYDASAPTPEGDGEHILIVDDEKPVARYASLRLQQLGYRTTVYNDPRQALESLLKKPSYYDAIITDLTMPHLTGLDLLRTARASGIDIPGLLISGNPDAVSPGDLEQIPRAALAAKPFVSDDLARLLHQLLHPDSA